MSATHNRISIQEPLLNILRKEKIPVSILLTNGLTLKGEVESFDSTVVCIRKMHQASSNSAEETKQQLIYKHAILTIEPHKEMSDSFKLHF